MIGAGIVVDFGDGGGHEHRKPGGCKQIPRRLLHNATQLACNDALAVQDARPYGDAMSAGMELLAPTDALIIDLRGSDGGAPEMVAFLMTYFFDGDPIQSSRQYNRWKN